MKNPRGPKGQSSLEALLVLAVLVAVFAAFLPTASKTYDAIRFQAVYSAESSVLSRVSAYAREAALLGSGTRFSFDAGLAAEETRFFFDSPNRELVLSFMAFNRKRTLREPIGLPVSLPSQNFSAADYSFLVENAAGEISVSIRGRGVGSAGREIHG